MNDNQTDKILILCREYDKYHGNEPIVYDTHIPQDKIDEHLKYLNLRSRMNPELSYFAVLESNYIKNKDRIEKMILNEEKYDIFDDFIESEHTVFESNGIIKI